MVGIFSAFGLSASAGLNAYLPLLLVAIFAKLDVIKLNAPFDALTSWWAIGILVVLLIIEFFVDKIPAVDTLNNIINTLIRPAAGAVTASGRCSGACRGSADLCRQPSWSAAARTGETATRFGPAQFRRQPGSPTSGSGPDGTHALLPRTPAGPPHRSQPGTAAPAAWAGARRARRPGHEPGARP